MFACMYSKLCTVSCSYTVYITKVKMRYDGMVGFPGGTVDKGNPRDGSEHRDL